MSASQPYLCKPGGALLALPWMRPGSTFDPSRGESVTTLSGGGTTVTRRLTAKRAYSFVYDTQAAPSSPQITYPSFTSMAPADLLLAIYGGLFDDPLQYPWTFVDPTVRNVLSQDVSATGKRSQAALGWVSSSGAVAPSTAIAAPVLGAGVLSWAAPANGTLTIGSSATSVDPTKGHPYLPAESHTASLYAASSTPVPLTLSLRGYDATGVAVSGAFASQAFTTTSTMQRYAVSIPPLAGTAYGVGVYGSGVYGGSAAAGFAGCAFIRLTVTTGSTTPTSAVLFSAAQLEYGSTVSAWQPGHGTPRVVITSSIGRAVQMVGYSDHTLTMAEV